MSFTFLISHICDQPLQNESLGTFWRIWVMYSTLFYVQLPSKWAITYQNWPSACGVIKFLNFHTAQYKVSGNPVARLGI